MYKLQKILRTWKKESGTTRVIQYKYYRGTLTLYTSQPGLLIGCAGALVDKYTEILKENYIDFKQVNFVETEYIG